MSRSNAGPPLTIGEVSERSGVSARSLRHYEKLGLLTPPRDGNGYRLYSENAVSTAATIHAIFSLGFSRDDVRAFLPCAQGTAPHDDPALLARVADLRDQVDEQMRVLSTTRAALSAFLAGEYSA
ncbi:MerR family transcriptional regulator [Microbacterium sp. NPDC091313]